MYGHGNLARIYEVLPLLCPQCGGEMRIITFITETAVIREILGHLGKPTSPPCLLAARWPPLWEMPGTEPGESDPPGATGAGLRVRSTRGVVEPTRRAIAGQRLLVPVAT